MKMLDFACRDCERVFEELVFDDTTVRCPQCKSQNVERQISACAVAGSASGVGADCGPSNSGFT